MMKIILSADFVRLLENSDKTIAKFTIRLKEKYIGSIMIMKNNMHTTLCAYIMVITLISVTLSPPLGNLFMGISALAAILSKQIRNDLVRIFKSRFGVAFLIWVIILLLYVIFTQSDFETSLDSLRGWRKLLMLPIALAIFSGRPWLQKQIMLGVIFIFTLISIISLIQYNFPELMSFLNKRNGIIMSTTGIHTIAMSVAAVTTFVYINYYWSELVFRLKFLLFFCLLVITLNVFFISTGRSGYIGFYIMFFVSLLMIYRNKPLKWKILSVSLLSGIILIAGLSSSNLQHRVIKAVEETKTGIDQPERTSVGMRLTYYQETVKMLPKYIFLGIGTGAFETAYSKQVSEREYPGNLLTSDPHNQYFRVFVEQSAIGLVFFLFLLYQIAKQPVNEFIFQVLGISVLASWLVTSLLNSHFSTFPEGSFIWIWLGIMFAPKVLKYRS